MEIKGKVTQVLPLVQGTSQSGNQWCKQEFVIETDESYPRTVCLTLFGSENIEKYKVAVGQTITAQIDIESREYNGRWYTNVKAWRVEQESAHESAHEPMPAPQPREQRLSFDNAPKDDDLPF